MRETILGYFILGVMWGAWLEYYTTFVMKLRPWIMNERIFHTFVWPISVGIFLYNLFKF